MSSELHPTSFGSVATRIGRRWTLLRIAALSLLAMTAVAFADHCLLSLRAVRDASPCSDETMWVVTAAFVGSVVLLLVVEVAGVARRFRRPEQQVRLALQRVRAGDVGFRLGHRRGEPLGRLLHECNDLLEWLNHNPPAGVRVDQDVFDLADDDEVQP